MKVYESYYYTKIKNVQATQKEMMTKMLNIFAYTYFSSKLVFYA